MKCAPLKVARNFLDFEKIQHNHITKYPSKDLYAFTVQNYQEYFSNSKGLYKEKVEATNCFRTF